jgi:pyridoxamine 5'-phosphate oxidase
MSLIYNSSTMTAQHSDSKSVDFPPEFEGLTEPFAILKLWWDAAHATRGPLNDPNAVHLTTVDAEQRPHGRVVLVKELRAPSSVVIYTNYTSQKGQEIAQNPNVALTFFWDPLYRQIRLEGRAAKTSRSDSEAYWASRPRARQLSQWISRQSEPTASRAHMEAQLKQAEKEFDGRDVPCPAHWGGYSIHIQSYEFWAGHPDRFHDRIRFTKVQSSWQVERLYP